ncbi:MAG: hypothetical protein WBF71_08565 [Microthrixaceae bacterium]
MTFVLVAFALLAITGVLMRRCVSQMAEATELINGLSAQNWLETSGHLTAAAVGVNEQISDSRASWAK